MKRTRKIIASIMTGVVALLSVVFTGCAGNETGNVPVPPPQTEQSSGFETPELSEDENKADNGLKIKIERLSASVGSTETGTEAVSTEEKPSYLLTVVLEPVGTIGYIDWSIAWYNAESTWASEKMVTDYVTLTPTVDGATTAKAEYLQEFGEIIIITASLRDTESTATCTVNCDLRFEDDFRFMLRTDSVGSGMSGFYCGYDDLGDWTFDETTGVCYVSQDAPNVLDTVDSFLFSCNIYPKDFTTCVKGLASSRYLRLYSRASEEFNSALINVGLTSSNEWTGFRDYTTNSGTVMTLSSNGTVYSSETAASCYVSQLLGFCPDIFTEKAFDEDLIDFIAAAQAVEGHHYEIKLSFAPYEDATQTVDYLIYVTFTEESLIGVQAQSISSETTDVIF